MASEWQDRLLATHYLQGTKGFLKKVNHAHAVLNRI